MSNEQLIKALEERISESLKDASLSVDGSYMHGPLGRIQGYRYVLNRLAEQEIVQSFVTSLDKAQGK